MNRLTEKQLNDIIRFQEANIGRLKMKMAEGECNREYMTNDIQRRQRIIDKYEKERESRVKGD